MNCQDISRIADTGSIRNLAMGERDAAESHALSCRDCAPIWGVQSQLAGLRVPATPPELAARLRVLATTVQELPVRQSRRWLGPAGVVVALAAAAGLAIYQVGAPVPLPQTSVASAPETTMPVTKDADPLSDSVTAVAPPVEDARPAPESDPLFPLPVELSQQAQQVAMLLISQRDLALQKAVERHPELVDGPEIDGTFVVGMALRDDGSVFASAIRHAPPDRLAAARREIDALTPGETTLSDGRPKSTRLGDGRMLRTNVAMLLRNVPDGFDVTRSHTRVLQILGNRYAHLLTPVINGELNRMEVFLAEDGSVVRERVDRIRSGDSDTGVTRDPSDVARFAGGIASRLGLDVGQVGVVGLTSVVEPPSRLLISYAWARRPGESAPTLGGFEAPPGLNLAAAVAIVERHIPDAFSPQDPGAGQAAVVLSAKGEFIRAGRVTLPMGSLLKPLEGLLDAGMSSLRSQTVRLTNAAGATADVSFTWVNLKTEPAGP